MAIKGYCSDFNEASLSNENVISHYYYLCRVEQSFRMSKSDIETRHIYHRKEETIRSHSHVLICFIALIIEKYLELETKLSLREIRFLIWNITEAHIQDKFTKKIFTFRSPTNDIMESPPAK